MSNEFALRRDGLVPSRGSENETPLPPTGAYPRTSMRVKKRDGSTEPVDVNKIVRAVSRSCVGLADVDPMRVAT